MINILNDEVAKGIIQYIESERERIKINSDLFDISENHIGALLKAKMIEDLSKESAGYAASRKCPINILNKAMDKLSKIYQQEPRREVINGKDSDETLVEKFEGELNIDYKLNINNEHSNLYMNSLLQIGVDKRKPFVRTIPSNKFLIMNHSPINPTSDDVVILFMDPIIEGTPGAKLDIYWIHTDEQFAIYDSRGTIRLDLMAALGQDGTNPIGIKNFMYLNYSDNLVMPKPQEDTLDVSLLIPLLISDSNYIAKFSTFSIMYGIDIDDKDMKKAPNTFWKFKSDAKSDKTPSIGTIKPEGDIDTLLKSAMTQLSVWLNTKGIKPGSIGQATVDNAASGIAKMIDEGDVTEIRTHQASVYRVYESQFWDLLLNHIYPFWKEQNLIDDYGTFSVGAEVNVNFKSQAPLASRGTLVKDLKEEVDAGFTTKRRAVMALNPKMSEKEIDELISEIEAEEPVQMVVADGETSGKTEQDGDQDNGQDS